MKSQMYKQLLKDNQFDSLLEYLEDDFINLYKEVLEYKNIKIDEEWNLTKLGCEVVKIYPNYKNSTSLVDSAFFSGEFTNEEALDTLLRIYGSIKRNYKNM